MKFKHVAGASIVPTLARLVLAFIFITAGYNKLFVDVSYTLEDAQKLKELGVRVEPDPGATAARAFEIVPASYRRLMIQDDPEKTADDPPKADEPAKAGDPTKTEEAKKLLEEAKESAREALDAVKEKSKAAGEAAREETDKVGEAIEEKADEAGAAIKEAATDAGWPPKVTLGEGETPEGEGDAASEPGTGSGSDDPAPASGDDGYKARALHGVTLECAEAGMPSPDILAMVAAWTEFVGGALLLVGFLSRIWGLGLAIAMGTAFYLTSWTPLCDLLSNGGVLALAKDLKPNMGLFQMMGLQLTLFVLSFGILLTGPGPISLDRFLFGRRGSKGSGTIVFDDGEGGGDSDG